MGDEQRQPQPQNTTTGGRQLTYLEERHTRNMQDPHYAAWYNAGRPDGKTYRTWEAQWQVQQAAATSAADAPRKL